MTEDEIREFKVSGHSAGSRRHRAGCQDCRDKFNALERDRRIASGETTSPYRARAELTALGELYGDDLRNAVRKQLFAYPVGLTALEIARALHMTDPEGGGQIRVRYQLARMEAGEQAAYFDEPRADGSARTCRRWYPAAVAAPGLAA